MAPGKRGSRPLAAVWQLNPCGEKRALFGSFALSGKALGNASTVRASCFARNAAGAASAVFSRPPKGSCAHLATAFTVSLRDPLGKRGCDLSARERQADGWRRDFHWAQSGELSGKDRRAGDFPVGARATESDDPEGGLDLSKLSLEIRRGTMDENERRGSGDEARSRRVLRSLIPRRPATAFAADAAASRRSPRKPAASEVAPTARRASKGSSAAFLCPRIRRRSGIARRGRAGMKSGARRKARLATRKAAAVPRRSARERRAQEAVSCVIDSSSARRYGRKRS